MAENNPDQPRGIPQAYKLDRGGVPAQTGPFIGIVVQNVDNIRSGRLQVVIKQFTAMKNGQPSITGANTSINLTDESLWRTVIYCPPFYGSTQQSGTKEGVGTYPGNPNSYGMWFTPPDLYTEVVCFFFGGDGSEGIYLACLPNNNNHMIPAIGSSKKYQLSTTANAGLFANTPQLPVTEINDLNVSIAENPRFFDQPAPVQSRVAGVLLQQGLSKDPIRGPITSSAQRESPSSAYGISTPGRAIYRGINNDPVTFKEKIRSSTTSLKDVEVVGRAGGHTFVMDDGDIDGKDTLIRIRTAKGHQITMSDDGDCFYITHANGQAWIELGKEGTMDVFSTNSVNIRTQGFLNLHADKGINMYSGGAIKIKSKASTVLNAIGPVQLTSDSGLLLYSKKQIGILSDGALAMTSKSGSWDGGNRLVFKATRIDLNGASATTLTAPTALTEFKLANVKWDSNTGWVVEPNSLPTIVTRAPTHEPYPYHNLGVNATAEIAPETPVVDPNLITQDDATGVDLAVAANKKADEIALAAVYAPIDAAALGEEPVAPMIYQLGGINAQQATALTAAAATNQFANFPAYDAEDNLLPGFELDEDNNPVYTGADIGNQGVGRYGQSTEDLVLAGLVKPATLGLILSPSMTSSVLNTNAVWTGLLGITGLLAYLSNKQIQNETQLDIMGGAYQGLVDAGVLNSTQTDKVTATFVQTATKFGVDTVVDWLNNDVDSATNAALTICGRQAQYAIDFVDIYSQVVNPGNYSGTTVRTGIDQAVVATINNSKIQPDNFGGVVANVIIPPVTNEDGTFRFAPGSSQG